MSDSGLDARRWAYTVCGATHKDAYCAFNVASLQTTPPQVYCGKRSPHNPFLVSDFFLDQLIMTSPSFDSVLGTNHVPTHDERRLLATLIESREQELSSLNDIISLLLAKRDKLNANIVTHKALLSPVRRLLPELLSEVFTQSVNYVQLARSQFAQENDSLRRFATPSVNEAPLVLGRICRRWRKIALSTPSLWSTLSIPWSESSIDGLKEWTSRAGLCNLSFTLLIRREHTEISKILVSYQKRWRDVVLVFDSLHIESWRAFVESLSPDFPCLQTLEICCRVSSSEPVDIPLVIDSAPNLRELIIRDPSFTVTTLDNSLRPSLRKIEIMGGH